jgi:hypothetical protein
MRSCLFGLESLLVRELGGCCLFGGRHACVSVVSR